MLVSGAVALTMSDHLPWPTVYAIMACAMAIGIAASLIAEEPETHTVPAKNLDEAFTRPLIQFMSRISAFEIIAFIILYKMGDTFAGLLSTPFLVSKGYSNTTIGLLNKFVGAGGTIVGAGMGGGLVVRWGIGRSLFVFGVFQMVSNLVYLVLTAIPANPVALGICIGLGYSDIAVVVSVLVILVLVLSNLFEDRVLGRSLTFSCEIVADDPDGKVRLAINQALAQNNLNLDDFDIAQREELSVLTCRYSGHRNDHKKFILDLWSTPGIKEVRQG
jgi:hypothetical protein